MKPRRFLPVVLVLLALSTTFSLAVLPIQPAWADAEDAAIFYEELAKFGNWYEDEDYGPAWYPTQDPTQEPPKAYDATFRPNVDGRWTPTDQGFMFETNEPWGWATYHYGNWTLSNQGRWIWVPGRTWYPNTVNFKTSEEYVGWAPLPPPKVKKALAVTVTEEPGEAAPAAPAPIAAPPPAPDSPGAQPSFRSPPAASSLIVGILESGTLPHPCRRLRLRPSVPAAFAPAPASEPAPVSAPSPQ